MSIKSSPKKFKTIFHAFWPVIRSQIPLLVVSTLAGVVGFGARSLVQPLLYEKIIQFIEASVVVDTSKKEVMRLFWQWAAVMIVIVVAFRVVFFTTVMFQTRVIKSMWQQAFGVLLMQSRSFFQNTITGTLIAKTKRYVKSFEGLHDDFNHMLLPTLVVFPGVVIILFKRDVVLGTIFLAWLVGYTAIVALFVKKKRRLSEDRSAQDSKVTGAFSDVFTNIDTVHTFAQGGFEYKNLEKETELQRVKTERSWFFGEIQHGVQAVLVAILQVVSMYWGIRLWLAGSVDIGFLVLLQLYVAQVVMVAWNIGWGMRRVVENIASAKEMIQLLNRPPEVRDIENPKRLTIKGGGVSFDKVSFVYKGGDAVFNNFDLIIPAGQKVGLVGVSGSGKSTLVSLMLRFFDPISGALTIDGQDIKKVAQNDLRKKIAYVSQEPILFHRTVFENIAYAKPDASKDQVVAAAKKAHAHEFITNLRGGYNTLVGERGVKLSGGQRQRIAIARAMLEDTPILLLDEATSALDSISEGHIQAAFEAAMSGGRTTIVIAHRLATIQKLDRIIVLKDGVIAEDGTHEELRGKEGEYYQLWKHQVLSG